MKSCGKIVGNNMSNTVIPVIQVKVFKICKLSGHVAGKAMGQTDVRLAPQGWQDRWKIIVLFGPTLAAMCKQCAIPVTQKAGKQRSLFDSGEMAVTSLCHSRASRLWAWLYKRETSKIACKYKLDS